VTLDKNLSESTSDTDKLSILYPLPEKRPTTRANTPGSLSTMIDKMCLVLIKFDILTLY
jgi:hypothetical protein